MWHSYFTGPNDWGGIYRVLAYKQGECPIVNGPIKLPYCEEIPGTTSRCQNCVGGICPSRDTSATDAEICKLPTSMGGIVPQASICPSAGPGLPQFPSTKVVNEINVDTLIGDAVMYRTTEGDVRITITTHCPWMIWSSPNTEGTDVTNSLTITYQLEDQFPVVRQVPMTHPNTSTGYYTCYTWVFPIPGLAAAGPCQGLSTLRAKVSVQASRMYSRDTADYCVPDNPDSPASPITGVTGNIDQNGEALANWVEFTDPCGTPQWTGVTCNGGTVTGVDFSGLPGIGSGPVGPLPFPEPMKWVTTLTSLDFGNVAIVGTLPESYSSLTNLMELNIDNVPGVTGSLPPGVVLEVANTDVKGFLPEEWSELTSLSKLDLSGNELLTNGLRCEWSTLTKLTALYVDGSNIGEVLPAEYSVLENLVILNVTDNVFVGTLPEQVRR
eukprot:gene16158-22319_t